MTKHLKLLGYRMARIFPILLFIGLAWGQYKYPYFEDMNKQLKCDQEKIIGFDFFEITNATYSIQIVSNYIPWYSSQ